MTASGEEGNVGDPKDFTERKGQSFWGGGDSARYQIALENDMGLTASEE